jgi:DNA-binding LytR/AlgR family response regulator
MKIKCILIDDEPLSIKVLQNHFVNFQDFEVVCTFNNALEALEYISKNPIDVVFTDINMPMMTGLELIRLIENKTHIIITSAYREFAAESYDLDVLDYLIKPIPLSRFIKCTHKIKTELQSHTNLKTENHRIDSHIFLRVDKKMIKINIDEILFIEGMKEYIKVITTDKTYITYKSLTALSEELPVELFLRIHKSYTIAINKVKSIEGNRIQIMTYTIPIGRNYCKVVKHKILE